MAEPTQTPPPAPAPRSFVPRDTRNIVFEKLGNAPRTKDDINAELLGLDRL